MTSVYLANVTGDGLTPDTAFRPLGFDAVAWASIMVDSTRKRALILSPDDTISGTGINNLVTAGSLAALRTAAQNNSPGAAKRTTINTWLTNGGYTPLPPDVTTWWDVIHFIARQVNPAADLGATSA